MGCIIRYVSEKSDGSNVLAFGPQRRLLYISNFTQISRDVYRNIPMSKIMLRNMMSIQS